MSFLDRVWLWIERIRRLLRLLQMHREVGDKVEGKVARGIKHGGIRPMGIQVLVQLLSLPIQIQLSILLHPEATTLYSQDRRPQPAQSTPFHTHRLLRPPPA